MLPIRSADGMKWITTGKRMDFEGAVFRDDRDTDPQCRYKMIHHGWAEFDSAGAIARYLNRGAWMAAGGLENHALIRTVFSAVSADGINWSDRHVVVRENGVQPGKRWWSAGPFGWAGGDNFPCVLWAPDIGKYVSFYRTNIDNGDGQRRERSVGRSESEDFRSWEPHSLALRAAPLWQDAMGYRKHDLYQIQVWRCGGVYLGILSVYYWQEDRVHIELAWSPDTRSWERICPGSDLVPHPPLGNGRGGCRYGLMRPIPVGDELHVYFGEDNGRHSADKFRAGAVYVARFRRDRLAGYIAKGGGRVSLVTRPFSLRANHLLINADGRGGEIQAELLRESGERLAASEILRSDSLQAELTWGDKKLGDFANARIRLRLLLRGPAKVYAMATQTL